MKRKKLYIDISTEEKKKSVYKLFDGFRIKQEIYDYYGVSDTRDNNDYITKIGHDIGFDFSVYKKRINESKKVKSYCEHCGKELKQGQYKYCSRSCSAKANNKKRTLRRNINKESYEKFSEKENGRLCCLCGNPLHGMQRKYCGKCKGNNNDFLHIEKTCICCGNPLSGRKTKFCSNECKRKYYSSKYLYNTEYSRKKDEIGMLRKVELIKKLGGCCSSCGYDYNPAALCFHHVNPLEKRFIIDARTISRKDEKTLMEEVSKCILLCQNCHHEIHHPKYNNLIQEYKNSCDSSIFN